MNRLGTGIAATIICLAAGCASVPPPHPSPVRHAATARMEAGVAAFTRNDVERAEEEFAEAYRLHASLDNREGMATALVNLARLNRLAGKIDAAKETAARGFSLCGASGDLCGEALFEMARLTEGSEEAAHWIGQGMTVAGPRRLPRFQNLLARFHLSKGQEEKATAAAVVALNGARTVGDRDEEINALLLLGETAVVRKDEPPAAARFTEALALAREREQGGKIAAALRGLGDAALLRGEREEAALFYRRASSVAEALGNAPLAAELGAKAKATGGEEKPGR